MGRKEEKKKDQNRITFKEFWAISLAQYSLALPGLLIMILSLLAVYFLVDFFF